MKAHVERRSPIVSSFRVEQVRGMFDLAKEPEVTHSWDVNLPIEENPKWQIGLIVGQSGAGKSVLARELFPDAHFHESSEWHPEKAIVDSFPDELEGKEIIGALSSVGLSSPPHWLKPYAHLSNGQKFRCELARSLLLSDTETIIFDEFTSVVDRDVAKICSVAISKAIRRRQRPRFIALSCHYDIIDWLQPDWIYDVSAERFEWRTLRRHPEIKLSIYRCDRRAWTLFRQHHYLNHALSAAAHCYVALWNEKPVAFHATLPLMGFFHARRGHRTVVLPDYQGAGIGNRLTDFFGELHKSQGFAYFTTTSHPAFIHALHRNPRWEVVRKIGSRTSQQTRADLRKTSSRGRLTSSFKYVGQHTSLRAEDPALMSREK